MGRIQVQVSFSIADLAQVKLKLGHYSENPKFVEGFRAICLQFELSWGDVNIILSTCCITEEKKRIWDLAQRFGDNLAVPTPTRYPLGATEVRLWILDGIIKEMQTGKKGPYVVVPNRRSETMN